MRNVASHTGKDLAGAQMLSVVSPACVDKWAVLIPVDRLQNNCGMQMEQSVNASTGLVQTNYYGIMYIAFEELLADNFTRKV
jgi:hypothetical protein